MSRPVPVFLLALGLTFSLLALPALPASAAADCSLYFDDFGYVCRAEPDPPVFATPRALPRALAFNTTYARLADNVNVYPEPNGNAPPLYSRGKGFLFVTLRGQVEANGEKWYRINPGQYVRASSVRVVSPSRFQGVEVRENPQRPFGWIVSDVVPSNEPGGEPDPEIPRLRRYDFFEVYDAAEGGDGWVWYQVGYNAWIRQTNVSLVDPSPKPEAVGEDEYWVEVDLYEQTFAAYVGRRIVYAGLVSSGLPKFNTREGLFQVWSRHFQNKMSGQDGKPEFYYLEDVPHIMYFDKDIGLHGAYWHNRFGFRASRGCVNMAPADAEWLFYWSANAPNRLWVWVHSSDPRHYFEKYSEIGRLRDWEIERF